MSPEWWREYRRRRGESLREYNRDRRKQPKVKAQRHASEARRRAKVGPVDVEPVPSLFPELQHGSALSFWEDELRMDLAQEAELARLEGRCPVEAVKQYRGREIAWKHLALPWLYDQPEGSGGEGTLDF